MARPGIMLYFDIRQPLKVLPDADKGRLFDAILEYGEFGVVPEFEGMLAMAWGFIQTKIDRDAAEYNRSVLRRQYATACRERKKKGETEISFEEWLTVSGNNHPLSCDTNDNQWYPTTTVTPTTNTTSSISTSTTTTPTATATATPTATPTATAPIPGEENTATDFETLRRQKMKMLQEVQNE